MTDADSLTVAERRAQLHSELNDAGVPAPRQGEAFILIPKRHIEAWLYFFETGGLDEEGRFENQFASRLAAACKEAATRITLWLNEANPEGPPSLLAGRNDLVLLRQLARDRG